MVGAIKQKRGKTFGRLMQALPEVKRTNDFNFQKLEELAKAKSQTVSQFVFLGIRNEAAHFLEDSDVNLDDINARQLFSISYSIMEDLARFYIEEKLGISSSVFTRSGFKRAA